MKKLKPEEFRLTPGPVFREAYVNFRANNGEKVIIEHSRYDDVVFELRAIEKGSNWEDGK